MDTTQSVERLIQEAYNKLEVSDAEGAATLLEKALQIDFDHAETKYALKSVNWWLEHIRPIKKIQNEYEKGGFILSQLKPYHTFLAGLGGNFDLCQYTIRRFVYSSALGYFRDLLGDGVNQHDPGLLLLVGRCYKGIGNYNEALKYLEQAIRFKREDGETLAELADIHDLRGDSKLAKALFREAFFLNPEKIDLQSIESGMILRLRDRLAREKGYKNEELCEWLPVYGRLWEVFNIKFELTALEFGKLKQSILNMEAERRSNPGKRDILNPRLINRYFWLIDYYLNKREDPELIEEVQLKIKIIDPDIYDRYIR